MRNPFFTTALGITLCLFSSGLLVGCGSGSHNVTAIASSKSASLVITVKWPKKTRLIPVATASIKVDIADKAVPAPGNIIATTTIPQGQTTTTIPALPAGNLTMTATALDANGAAVARGPKDVTTQVNVAAQVTINMVSTIDLITVTPSNPTVSVQGRVQLQAGATNTDKEMVLLTPSKLSWQPMTTTDATFATVDAHSGIVTGVKQGTANIQVTDTESGKIGGVMVMVGGIDHVDLTPANPTVAVGNTVQLTANPKDKDGNAVTGTFQYQWKSLDTSVATVDPASGNVTGVKAGTAQITATETASDKSASVTVIVGTSFVGQYIGDLGGMNALTIDSDDGTKVTAFDSRYYNSIDSSYVGTRSGNHLILVGNDFQVEGDLVDGAYSGTYTGAHGFTFPVGPMNFNNRKGWKGNQFAWDYEVITSTGDDFAVRVNTDGSCRAGLLANGSVSELFISGSSSCSDGGVFTMPVKYSSGAQGTFTGTLVKGSNGITGSGTFTKDSSKGTWTMSQLQ